MSESVDTKMEWADQNAKQAALEGEDPAREYRATLATALARIEKLEAALRETDGFMAEYYSGGKPSYLAVGKQLGKNDALLEAP